MLADPVFPPFGAHTPRNLLAPPCPNCTSTNYTVTVRVDLSKMLFDLPFMQGPIRDGLLGQDGSRPHAAVRTAADPKKKDIFKAIRACIERPSNPVRHVVCADCGWERYPDDTAAKLAGQAKGRMKAKHLEAAAARPSEPRVTEVPIKTKEKKRT